ncbi:RusA family crossover junction endodeoxyribonuclease [Streptosporangium sandarakinum]
MKNSALWEAVAQETPDFALIKQMVADAYHLETGDDPSNIDSLVLWLRRSHMYNDNFPDLMVKLGRLHHAVFDSVEEKIGIIRQRPCYVCLKYPTLPIITFSLRVSPQSRQVELQGAFKRAVAAAMINRREEFAALYDRSLCIAVTFVMAKGRKLSDVDNMAKTYLDALQKSVYRNDRQITHLDAIRLRSHSKETFIVTRIMGTEVDELDDVIRQNFRIKWAGKEIIDLSNYL